MFEKTSRIELANQQFAEIDETLSSMRSEGMERLSNHGVRGCNARARELLALARCTENPAHMQIAQQTFQVFHEELIKRELEQSEK